MAEAGHAGAAMTGGVERMATQRSGGGRTALLIGWAGLGAAAIAGAGASWLVAGWAALGLAGAMAFSRHRADGAAAAFEALHNGDPDPMLLVTATGEVLSANAAALRRAPDAGARLADHVGAPDDAQAALYRIGRAVRASGFATGDVDTPAGPVRVMAQAVSGGRQIWRLGPAADDPAAVADGPRGPAAASTARTTPEDSALGELPVALARLSADGRILYLNTAARRLLGGTADTGDRLDDLLEGLAKSIRERLADTIAGKAQGRSEVARTRQLDRFLQVTMSRVCEGEDPTILAVLSDATELKTLEAQFVQSQKMQAVGQLAGGIAHDFNNLLTAINGHCDLLLLRHVQGDNDHCDLMQIRQNTNRAASLVRQLLAFSRKQTLKPQVLNLYDTLSELASLLDRLLSERVELEIRAGEEVWPVRADERQLEQAVVNLVVNARDAMPEGGRVTLSTRNLELSEPLVRDRATIAPGRYAVIEVADTGTGIAPDKINKIFEPFFTTKRVGEGTGLGLSTVYGIIKQMDGFVFVDSTPGEGSTFSIYLPASDAPLQTVPADKAADAARFRDATGSGVVLLVEDEAPVRSFAARALRLRGYTVIEAECGERALEILADGSLKVDLFLSDVVMPGMDGPGWVREAYRTRPEASTIFISGYAEDAFAEDRPRVPRSSYLAKPFTLDDLSERVREHMDRYQPAPA